MAQIEQFPSYFNAIGGLNTESSPVNPQPNESTDLDNVILNLDGSIKRRSGFNTITDIFTTHSQNFLFNGKYETPVLSNKVFSVTNSANQLKTFNILHIGTTYRIHLFDNLYNLQSTPYQTIDLGDDCEERCAYFPTTFLVDRDTIICINKYTNLVFIKYNPVTNLFVKYSSDVLVRDLGNNASLDSYVTNAGKVYKCIRPHKVTGTDDDYGTAAWPTLPSKVTTPTSFNLQMQGGPDPFYYQLDFNGSTIEARQVGPSELVTVNVNDIGSYKLILNYESGTNLLTYFFEVVQETSEVAIGGDYTVVSQYGYEVPSTVSSPGLGSAWQFFWELVGDSTETYSAWANDTDYTSNIKSIFCYWDKTKNGTKVVDDWFSYYKVWNGTSRFDGGCLAGNRLWLFSSIKSNEIIFSRLVRDETFDYFRAYQFADPYNKFDSSLVDTDGGTIVITGAEKIYSVVPFGVGVLVFANNGVWQIKSGDSFVATNFSIDKITEEGNIALNTAVGIEDSVVYITPNGVNAIITTDFGTSKVQSISNKIDTLFKNISLFNKKSIRLYYDYSEKKIYILYNRNQHSWDTLLKGFNQQSQYRDILVFDIRLKAWYKLSLSEDTTGNKLSISHMFFTDRDQLGQDVVIDNDYNVVTDSTDATVYHNYNTSQSNSISPSFIFFKRNSNTIDYQYGYLDNDIIGTDFDNSTADKETYDSYYITVQNLFTDVFHQKQTPYVIPVFKRMESGVLDDDGFDLTPGGCLANVSFNWASNIKAAKYGTFYSVYHPYKFNLAYHDGSQDGYDIVTSKIKMRGRGKSFQLTFKNDGTKDFHLFGWQILVNVNRGD